MDQVIGFLVGAIVVLLLVVALRSVAGFATVHDYERGLRYRAGRFTGLVDPGVHLTLRPFNEVRILDGRPVSFVVEGQEILTADGVALKVSLAARYVIGDAVSAVTGDQDFRRALYLTLQLALRGVVAARTSDVVLATRDEIGDEVMAACAGDLARLGIELLAVDVRDLMVPGDLKQAFAAVVLARRDGEAALERARAETAALRSLANAGRLVEDNPGLLQLRVIQQLGASSGNTIMLGLADGAGGAGSGARPGAAVRSRAAAKPPAED